MGYSRASYKHDYGQTITTDVKDLEAKRAFIAHLPFAELGAASTDTIIDGAEGPSGEEAEDLIVTEFDAQPDYARNVVVVVAATTAGHVAGEDIVVTGKNIAGEEITEAFAIVENTPATHTGNLAFAEITSVLIPVQDGDSVTVDVGVGKKIGVPYKEGLILKSLLGTSADTGTLTLDDDIEKCVYAVNGSPNGVNDLNLFLIV